MKFSHKNQNPFGPLFQNIVADGTGQHHRRIRHAIWLYLYLLTLANIKTGKLTTRIADIANATGISEETVRSWLGHLKKWHYVSVVKNRDGFQFKINRWKEITNVNDADPIGLLQKTTKGPPKGREPKELFPQDPADLARKIAGDLQATDSITYIENLCRAHSRSIVLKAFKEARALPAEKVKKSRGALFVYLTKKYAQEK